MSDLLTGPSYSSHSKPKKLIVMLHGYGDTAENFLYIANQLDEEEWGAQYISLNAPETIPNYSMGNQWFDIYPNGIYISDAGPNELAIIRQGVKKAIEKIEFTIKYHLNHLGLALKDCLVMGFSQGGMMTFELGNSCQERLGALAILSGRIMEQTNINNVSLKQTPIFISHGDQDDVLPVTNFYQSKTYLQNNNCIFEAHELKDDTHTISPKAINLLQEFIKKYL